MKDTSTIGGEVDGVVQMSDMTTNSSAAATRPDTPGAAVTGAPAAILIVDDSLTVRMDLADALQAAGLRCVTCSSMAEARLALATQPIGVAILDVLLPDGDGLELLQEIRATAGTADVPVLMLSTEAEVRDRIRGLQTGATDYVGKPYDRTLVVSRTWELLRGREPAPSSPISPRS